MKLNIRTSNFLLLIVMILGIKLLIEGSNAYSSDDEKKQTLEVLNKSIKEKQLTKVMELVCSKRDFIDKNKLEEIEKFTIAEFMNASNDYNVVAIEKKHKARMLLAILHEIGIININESIEQLFDFKNQSQFKNPLTCDNSIEKEKEDKEKEAEKKYFDKIEIKSIISQLVPIIYTFGISDSSMDKIRKKWGKVCNKINFEINTSHLEEFYSTVYTEFADKMPLKDKNQTVEKNINVYLEKQHMINTGEEFQLNLNPGGKVGKYANISIGLIPVFGDVIQDALSLGQEVSGDVLSKLARDNAALIDSLNLMNNNLFIKMINLKLWKNYPIKMMTKTTKEIIAEIISALKKFAANKLSNKDYMVKYKNANNKYDAADAISEAIAFQMK
ncbi:MAG: hypothetical protein HQK49_03740 [Oligoflexia bacterium]|nr:hypothetical protein [Oligoflexia bacterium]